MEAKEFKKLLKLIKFPGGDNRRVDAERCYAHWHKSGGYAGDKAISKLRSAAKAAGFVSQEEKRNDSPDGYVMGGSSDLVKGSVVITTSRHFGVTKTNNSYSITVKVKDPA